ncbi:MAG: CoA pyrophosphatase [Flavobacterium sp.]|nr:CoA pyrophosphatase [Flavobacterium sp.]
MEYSRFISLLPQLQTIELPGIEAQLLAVPPERSELIKAIDFSSLNYKKAAVTILLYPKQEQMHLVLIQRNTYAGVHSAQIAFPGGKIEESDVNPAAAALRETEEEIGVAAHQLKVVRAFTELYIPPSNFMVYPFLAFANEPLQFLPDPKEVSQVIEINLHDFITTCPIQIQTRATSYNPKIEVPCFIIQGHEVWGATAMVLSELKETFKILVR